MRVLVPAFDNEIFIKEFSIHLNEFVEVGSSFSDFWNVEGNYDVVHLHWPEYLLKWKEPTEFELLFLEKVLKEWKQKSKIVVTRHNYHPHYSDTEPFRQLYKLVYHYADGVVHLGHFCHKEYQQRYSEFASNQKHAVIPHALFTTYPNRTNSTEAREKLKISSKAFVMLVFGRVQSAAEKSLVLKAFDNIHITNKKLLAPGWRPAPGKEPVNRLTWFRVKHSKTYCICNNFISEEDVQYYMHASSLVFIPRVDTLNSGIPFLVAPFQKPMVGPDCGNIEETLNTLGCKVFDVALSSSIIEAIRESLSKRFDGYNQEKLSLFQPQVVSEQYFQFYQTL